MTAPMTERRQAAMRRLHELQRARTAARLEDLDFLLSVGEFPERAVKRVGWSLLTAEKMAKRYGRNDLAARIRARGA